MNKRKKKNINKLIKDYYRCSDKDERNNILVQKIIPHISNTTEKKEVINLCNRQLKIFEIKDYIGIFIPITLLPLLFDLSLRIIYKLIPSVQWGTVERFREYISIFLFSVAILLLIIDFLLTIFNKNYDNNYNIGIFNYDLYCMRVKILINTLSLDIHHKNINSSFCKNCKHYHGESYGGNVLICGMYPYGQENCPDFDSEKIVRITHLYSMFDSYFAVKTNYSLEELNLICAYLQFLKWQLPHFKTVDEDILEYQVVEVLSKLFGCQKIVTQKANSWDNEIDLYYNWNDYLVELKEEIVNKQFARPGVRLAIVEQMLILARENAKNEEGKKVIRQLQYLKNGGFVPKNWGWKLYSGEPYFGKINLDGEKDLLEI